MHLAELRYNSENLLITPTNTKKQFYILHPPYILMNCFHCLNEAGKKLAKYGQFTSLFHNKNLGNGPLERETG